MKKLINFAILFLLSISLYAKTYSIFKLNGNCGLIDENRKIVLSANYVNISIYDELCIICEKNNRSYTVFSPKLKPIYSLPEESFLNYFSDNEFLFNQKNNNGKYLGQKILNVKTGEISSYKKNDKFILDYVYRDNLVVVLLPFEDKPTFTVLDRNEKLIAKNLNQASWYYSEGLLAVIFTDGRSGFINTKGDLVIETPLYDDPRNAGPKKQATLEYYFHEGVAFIQTAEDQWYLLDKKGSKKEVPPEYNFATRRYSKGLTVVEDKEHKFGYMDKDFKLAIPCKFERAESFEGKYAVVVYQGKDGVIDKDGNIYFCEEFK